MMNTGHKLMQLQQGASNRMVTVSDEIKKCVEGNCHGTASSNILDLMCSISVHLHLRNKTKKMHTGKICINMYLLIKYKQICVYAISSLVEHPDDSRRGDGNM